MMEALEIPLSDRRRRFVQRMQLLQDVFGIVVLIPAASARLQNGTLSHTILGSIEIIAILLALGSAARELKSKHAAAESDVDWSNLFMGVVLFVEYGFNVAAGRKIVSPVLLAAITAVALAFARPLLQRRLGARRIMRIDDTGISVRTSRFRRFAFSWSELREVEERGDIIRFHLRDGSSHTLSLEPYDNAADIRNALRMHKQVTSITGVS